MTDLLLPTFIANIGNIPRVARPKQCHQKSVNVVTVFHSKKVIEIVMFTMNETAMVRTPK
jgi:hypothetical protein